jgi:hypothetical protein
MPELNSLLEFKFDLGIVSKQDFPAVEASCTLHLSLPSMG